MAEKPFNPLSYRSLGESVVRELVSRPVHPLPPSDSFPGAGIYALYATPGGFSPYQRFGQYNDRMEGRFERPIYVGKAVPKGSRMGAGDFHGTDEPAVYSRLCTHSNSIDHAKNLDVQNFYCRYLIVAPAWIGLAEQMMIRNYRPLWNSAIDGFGNNDPGKRRYSQFRSKWDVLHEGRPWAYKLADPPYDGDELVDRVNEYLDKHLSGETETEEDE